jgi:uncharacterized membrane protein YvbJ
MSYCPKCGFEYKPGINNCPDCGEKLLAGLKLVEKDKTEREKIVAETRLKLIYVTGSLIYANILTESLDKEQIPYLIKKKTRVNVEIFVKEEDYDKSLEIKELLPGSI